jgi:hypothetical protein
VLAAQRVEQDEEAVERFSAELVAEVPFDPASSGSLSGEVLEGLRGQSDDPLAAVGGRRFERHVTTAMKGADDLARSLAGYTKLAGYLGGGYLAGARAEPQHPAIRLPPIWKAGGCHRLVQSALVADPRAAQGAAECPGLAPASSFRSGSTRWSRLAALAHLPAGASLTTMVYILRHARRAWGRALLVALTLAVVAASVLVTCGSARASETSGGGTAAGSVVYRWGVVGNKGKIAKLELNRPTRIAGITGQVVQVATSNSDGYALTSDGQVYGWGVNSYGELGDGRVSPYQTRAVKIGFPAGVKITSLANPMPFDAGLAIDSAGRAWAWGLNGDSDLCLPDLIYTRPSEVPLSDVTLASGARTHALFDSDGVVYACGSGDAGELGNGSGVSASSPTPVAGLPSGVKVAALASSWEGSGALLADGSYYDWGYNAAGQLGDGTTTDSAVPVEVRLPDPVAQVFQGGSGPKNGQTIAILRNGSAWTWGDNDHGQLGTGTTRPRRSWCTCPTASPSSR